jgi:hypothetical protein
VWLAANSWETAEISHIADGVLGGRTELTELLLDRTPPGNVRLHAVVVGPARSRAGGITDGEGPRGATRG